MLGCQVMQLAWDLVRSIEFFSDFICLWIRDKLFVLKDRIWRKNLNILISCSTVYHALCIWIHYGCCCLAVSSTVMNRFATTWDLRFSHPWRENTWFSGLLHHVVWWLDASISEDSAASVFKAEMQQCCFVSRIMVLKHLSSCMPYETNIEHSLLTLCFTVIAQRI